METVKNAEEENPSARKFLVVAAIVNGKNTIAKENKYYTDPTMKMVSNGRKECPHAEVALLKGVQDKSIRGPMLVLRENAHGQLTLAKPCKYCHEYITTTFPKLDVFYSAKDGEIRKLRRVETYPPKGL